MTRNVALFTSQLGDASTLADLHRIGREFAESHRFQHFLYAVRIPKPPGLPIHFVVSGYPAEWRRTYDEREYLRIDPIVQHAFSSAMPIVWDEVPIRNEVVRAFFNGAASYGLAHGISAPICGRRGELGLFSLSRLTEIESEQEARLTLKQEMHWFTTAMHEAGMRVLERQPHQLKPTLTPREREALLLAHEGKKSAEIARQMRISERTVLYHLDVAGQKLGTSGRTATVAAAISLGELQPARQSLIGGRPLPQTREFHS